MRLGTLLVILAAVAGTVPSLAAAALQVEVPYFGPFAGVLGDGEHNEHFYGPAPTFNFVCPAVMVTYHMQLFYAPPSDTLGLEAGGQRVVGTNGLAEATFQATACSAFVVAVEGVSVAASAAYVVKVSQDG